MRRLLIIVVFLLCARDSRAQTLFVPSQHYPSIQAAIDDANDGDIVIVSPGIYYENINFLGKSITVRSAEPNDVDIVAATIIDGSKPSDPNIASVVTFNHNEDADSVLSGFTIQNGFGQSDPTVDWRLWEGVNGDGGGVLCSKASPTITRNIFKNCRAEYGGGGVFCHNNASPVIRHNTFLENYAGWYGGAIFARLKCSPTISNNVFKKNMCRYLGGAVYLADKCYSRITNNWFEGNQCELIHGGAIYYFVNSAPIVACNFFIDNTCNGPSHNGPTGAAILMEGNTSGKIINNLFTGNACVNSQGAVIKLGSGAAELVANNIVYANGDIGIATANGANPVICHNNVWDNAGGNYGGAIGDQTGINGNISADPQIGPKLPQPFGWHELHPGSPCIDAGSNGALPGWLTLDYDGTSRLVNAVVDIGPQEYHSIAVPLDFSTIQEAINASQSGGEVIVLPGFYRENVDFLDKNIRLRSVNPLDANCVAATVIDGNGVNSCIKIVSGQDESTAVAGLWLQNGHGEFGGGIHIGNSVGPVIMHNYITNNRADRYGGGVDCRSHSYGQVINNTIVGNFASVAGGGVHVGPGSSCLIMNNKIANNVTVGEAGGGIYTYNKTTAWIINNEITGNQALTANGGGIWQWESLGGIIAGNIIVSNTATATRQEGSDGRGGGIGILNGATFVTNNVVCGNRAAEGGGIWVQSGGTCKVVNNTVVGNIADSNGAGIGVAYSVYSPIANNIIAYNGAGGGIYVKPHSFSSEPNIIANDFWDNQGGNYIGDINDLTGINGNISAEPVFVANGFWADSNTPEPNDDYWVQGDYHIGYFSPCRDAGSNIDAPDVDFEGDARPIFTGVDMGADEAAMYDLTASGKVGFDDLQLLQNEWLSAGPALSVDLNRDGRVDFYDFALLAEGWLL